MTRLDPHDLFRADTLALSAGCALIRAVTAGEAGRYGDQKALVSEAADKLAQALALLNPTPRPSMFAIACDIANAGRPSSTACDDQLEAA